jgi:hypothetical protein
MYSEARIFFRAGKNRDGFFNNDDLLRQTDKAIDIFEAKTNGFATGLFAFDNAPGHAKRPLDGLSACKMPKFPTAEWTHHKNGPRMRSTSFTIFHPPLLEPITIHQDLYYPEDHPTMPNWFKGMQHILEERGLYPASGLRATCEGFKCDAGCTTCCCRRVLFLQPDFANQKSALEELITRQGHICEFYPKYHCETNFIEQYWGATKLRYRLSPKTTNMDQMEENVRRCLDEVPLIQIRR